MKWLKDIDNSFDSLLTDCYRQREMEMERHINRIRCIGLIALFLFEIGISVKVQMFQYQHHVLAMQFHPECNNHEIARLRNAFGNECPLEPIEHEIEAQVKAWLFKQLDNWITSCLSIS